MQQLEASANTVEAYRDTWRLLLRFAAPRIGKTVSALYLDDLNADLISAFLEHLQIERGNSARTRNTRLAAVRSFYRFCALEVPEHSGLIYRVLAIPQKRHDQRIVTFLNATESDALLLAPDLSTKLGRRDHALLLLMIETGLRVSETIGLNRNSVVLGTGAHVYCLGKGRKERATPIGDEACKVITCWLQENTAEPEEPLFTSRRGTRLSRDAVERLVTRHVKTAQHSCRSLLKKRVTPHVLRHTTAVSLLQGGVDRSIIALWLGHEQLDTTQIYLAADLSIKEKALARTLPHATRSIRYKPDDALLAFLESL